MQTIIIGTGYGRPSDVFPPEYPALDAAPGWDGSRALKKFAAGARLPIAIGTLKRSDAYRILDRGRGALLFAPV